MCRGGKRAWFIRAMPAGSAMKVRTTGRSRPRSDCRCRRTSRKKCSVRSRSWRLMEDVFAEALDLAGRPPPGRRASRRGWSRGYSRWLRRVATQKKVELAGVHEISGEGHDDLGWQRNAGVTRCIGMSRAIPAYPPVEMTAMMKLASRVMIRSDMHVQYTGCVWMGDCFVRFGLPRRQKAPLRFRVAPSL